MKLTTKHIGKLFDNDADGSWCYRLVDIKRGKLLFYDFSGNYVIDTNRFADWKPYNISKKFPNEWIKRGWKYPKYKER